MFESQSASSKKRAIVGILVEDEPGVLNRISGMFSRRGFNIDTVTVGKTHFPGISQIIISFPPDDHVYDQITSQLSKIVTVRKIIDLSEDESIIREYALIKLETESGKKTNEITHIVEKFNGKVLFSGNAIIIVELIGTPETVEEVIALLKPFTIVEISRTGINAMRKFPEKKTNNTPLPIAPLPAEEAGALVQKSKKR